jgi:heme/copper-type cytochrome/quinol oxidase subunit 2
MQLQAFKWNQHVDLFVVVFPMRLKRLLIIAMITLIGISVVSARFLTVRAATVTFNLYGSISGWGFTPGDTSNPTLVVTEGDQVSITLHNQDVGHRFYVDYDGNGAISPGEPASPTFTTTIVFNFTVDRSGTFTYYCAIHPTTMHGTFTSNPIPEYPTGIILFSFMTLVLLLVVFKRFGAR